MPSIAEVRQKFPQYNDMSDADLADALHRKYYSDIPKAEFDAKLGLQPQQAEPAKHERTWGEWLFGANPSPEKKAEMEAWQQRIHAPAEGPNGAINMLQGMTSNYADDAARMVGATGFADRINREQEQFRQSHPMGSMAAEGLGAGVQAVAGGGILGKVAPKAMAFMNPAGRGGVARSARYAAVAAPQAALAESGEQDATLGSIAQAGATGAAIGGAIPVVGNMARRGVQAVSNKIAERAAAKIDAKAVVPTLDDIAGQTKSMYAKMRADGAVIAEPSVDALRTRMLALAGKPNPNLRKTTTGMIDELNERMKGNLDFEDLHEISKEMNMALRRAEPQDALRLRSMKTELDNFIGGIESKDLVSGTPQAVASLREADKLYARQKKMELVQNIMDYADVNSARFSQSGLANAIKQEMKSLYRQITPNRQGKVAIKGFTEAEKKLIRQMAMGGSSSQVINWMAKFSPRGGLMGMLQGLGAGGSFVAGGVPGLAASAGLAGGGFLAARQADNAASKAAENLVRRIAAGSKATAPAYRQIPKLSQTPLDMILLPGGAGLATGISQR